MAPSESYLSSPKYGYDFVVGVTQASINATMLAFLASLQEPIVNICYVADSEGNPQRIDYEELKAHAGGTDPFSVPVGVDPNDPALQNLLKARFVFGFHAQIGIPPMDDPKSLPDIVVLGNDTTAVQYNMYCSDFTIVHLTPGGEYVSTPSFMNSSQQKNYPWVFSSKVNLDLSTVGHDGYNTLPPVVQAQIKNMSGSAFSIQQLLFDLNSAALSADIPTIKGMDPGSALYMAMEQFFVGAYFTELKKNGQPLLGCSIVHQETSVATMTVTDLNMKVCPYVDGNGQPYANPNPAQQSLATLNYLCAAGVALPAAVPFTWNWVDIGDVADHDGVLSINRNTFRHYFELNLADYVPKVCIATSATCKADGLGSDMTATFTPGQKPTITKPDGKIVLSYDYNCPNYGEAGLGGDLGSLTLDSTFSLTVEFDANTVIITQHLVIYVKMKKNFTVREANIVDKTIIDTYTIDITADGQMAATMNSIPTDNSQRISVDGFEDFFTHMGAITTDIENAAQGIANTNFQDIPVSTLQKYVFPGGQTFVFKDAQFSENQDLYASITYADPTGPAVTVPNSPVGGPAGVI